MPWRKAWQLTPVILPVEFHEQRDLVSYSPESNKESDTTEATWHACTYLPYNLSLFYFIFLAAMHETCGILVP